MKRFFTGVGIATILLLPTLVFAQSFGGNTAPTSQGGNTAPTYNVSNTCPGGVCKVDNPLNVGSFCGLIKALLKAALEIGIPIAVLFIVYAGFKFVIARGKSEALVEARRNLLYVLIGIGIFLGAWLLAQVIANTVNAVAGGNNALVSCK